jgi:putative effector of murein hydrolase
MERGIIMLLHSIIIGLILYIIMVFAFEQNEKVAENRSILIAAIVLIYMVLFGHGLPNKFNKDL